MGGTRGGCWHRVAGVALLGMAAAWAADAVTVQWKFTPSAPSAGQPVTYMIAVTNDTGHAVSFDLGVMWRHSTIADDNDNRVHEVTLAAGASENFSDSFRASHSGSYAITAYDMMDGPTDAIKTGTIQVGPAVYMDLGAINANIEITFSYAPANPVSVEMHPGVKDVSDMIHARITYRNKHASQVLRAHTLRVTLQDAQGSNQAMPEFAVPELGAGGVHILPWDFKLHAAPGRFALSYAMIGMGPPVLLNLGHTITTVADSAPLLLNPTFLPDNPTPATSIYSFEVVYRAPDNTAPDEIKLSLLGQTFTATRVDNVSFALGSRYRYTYGQTLASGSHTFSFAAFKGGRAVASTGPCTSLTVSDATPPVVAGGGQARPDVVIRDSGSVALSGTAADPESGIRKVEWRTSGGAWQTAQGANNWSFSYNSGTADQDYATKTFEVRAQNTGDAYTAAGGYWKQKVVWERRHPRIAETFVTGSGACWADYNPVMTAKPPARGTPLMGQPYYAAFKVTNPNQTDAYNLVMRWTETGVQYHPANPGWDVAMSDDAPNHGDPIAFTLGPGETKWVWTTWVHNWNWLEEPSPVNFMADFLFMFIPVVGDIADGISCIQWLVAAGGAVDETNWTLRPHAGMSAAVGAVPNPVTYQVVVPGDKQDLVLVSFTSSMCAMTATAVAAAVSWTGFLGAAGGIIEVACIAASHAAYYAAWDPNPDYKSPVRIVKIDVPLLDTIDEPAERKAAESAIRYAENMRAMCAAMARQAAASQAGDGKAAVARTQEAAQYADAAAREAQSVSRWIQTHAKSLLKLTDEDRKRIQSEFAAGLPVVERDLMVKSFGFDPKEVQAWGDIHKKAIPLILKDPKLADKAARSLSKSIQSAATKMEKEAKSSPKP